MLGAIRRLGMTHAIVSSSFVAATDREKCRGCKLCLRACPVGAITMIDTEGRGPRRYWSVVDPDRCLGCGVCFPVCRWGGRAMVPRPQRAYTPVTGLERDLAMAVERGKLGDYLVDTMEGQGPRAVAVALRILDRLAPDDARRAIEPLGSAYLEAFTRIGAGRRATALDAMADLTGLLTSSGPSPDRKHAPPRM
jgi:Fe-S-cluster-containing hydrogenase component 2